MDNDNGQLLTEKRKNEGFRKTGKAYGKAFRRLYINKNSWSI